MAYENLVAQLVPADRLSCHTDCFNSPDFSSFQRDYGRFCRQAGSLWILDIFRGPSLESLYDQVTQYAANYEALVLDLIRSLLSQNLQPELQIDLDNGVWTSYLTLGMLVDGGFFVVMFFC